MNPLCPACLATPASIDGHAEMSVRTIGNTMLTFQCRRCETHWARSASRGVFTWTQIDESTGRTAAMGSLVPPRSNPFRKPDSSAT